MLNEDLYRFETWKDIELDTKYPYQVSDMGRVRKVLGDKNI